MFYHKVSPSSKKQKIKFRIELFFLKKYTNKFWLVHLNPF